MQSKQKVSSGGQDLESGTNVTKAASNFKYLAVIMTTDSDSNPEVKFRTGQEKTATRQLNNLL